MPDQVANEYTNNSTEETSSTLSGAELEELWNDFRIGAIVGAYPLRDEDPDFRLEFEVPDILRGITFVRRRQIFESEAQRIDNDKVVDYWKRRKELSGESRHHVLGIRHDQLSIFRVLAHSCVGTLKVQFHGHSVEEYEWLDFEKVRGKNPYAIAEYLAQTGLRQRDIEFPYDNTSDEEDEEEGCAADGDEEDIEYLEHYKDDDIDDDYEDEGEADDQERHEAGRPGTAKRKRRAADGGTAPKRRRCRVASSAARKQTRKAKKPRDASHRRADPTPRGPRAPTAVTSAVEPDHSAEAPTPHAVEATYAGVASHDNHHGAQPPTFPVNTYIPWDPTQRQIVPHHVRAYDDETARTLSAAMTDASQPYNIPPDPPSSSCAFDDASPHLIRNTCWDQLQTLLSTVHRLEGNIRHMMSAGGPSQDATVMERLTALEANVQLLTERRERAGLAGYQPFNIEDNSYQYKYIKS